MCRLIVPDSISGPLLQAPSTEWQQYSFEPCFRDGLLKVSVTPMKRRMCVYDSVKDGIPADGHNLLILHHEY